MASPEEAQAEGWELRGAERDRYVRWMFDRISGPYDRLNCVISLGGDHRWRRLAVQLAAVGPGDRVVDLGTGTGDLALAFAGAVGAEGRVVGVDLAPAMLRMAVEKRGRRGLGQVHFLRGHAAATGLPDGWADAVGMGWVLRNLGDRPLVYAEIQRLLKPGGRLVIVDMSHPPSLAGRAGFWAYRHLVMPGLVRLLGGDIGAYRYLARSTDRFLGPAELKGELQSAGFREVEHRTLLLGSLAIHRALSPGPEEQDSGRPPPLAAASGS